MSQPDTKPAIEFFTTEDLINELFNRSSSMLIGMTSLAKGETKLRYGGSLMELKGTVYELLDDIDYDIAQLRNKARKHNSTGD